MRAAQERTAREPTVAATRTLRVTESGVSSLRLRDRAQATPRPVDDRGCARVGRELHDRQERLERRAGFVQRSAVDQNPRVAEEFALATSHTDDQTWVCARLRQVPVNEEAPLETRTGPPEAVGAASPADDLSLGLGRACTVRRSGHESDQA